MIEIKNINKSFDNLKAVDNVSLTINNGSIFGLIGTNGAGKSTLMRMMAGIINPDSGEIKIDGRTIFENIDTKQDFFYISDQQYFFLNATPKEIRNYYAMLYPNFNKAQFDELIKRFDLDLNRKIKTFSKGMKKQVSIITALAANTKYIFCDETFDGLDPVMRQAIKGLFASEVAERGLTPVIASHNLRELEDICDHVGLLHRGGVLINKDLDSMKLSTYKLQVIFEKTPSKDELAGILDIVSYAKRGSLLTLIVRGENEAIMEKINVLKPQFIEVLPLSLEEIFITETEVEGYDIKKLLG